MKNETKVIIEWHPKDITLYEFDQFVQKHKHHFKDINFRFDAIIYDYEKGEKVFFDDAIPPDQNYPSRFRIATYINTIETLYKTLRKINYAINQNLKEDVVSETLLYFMNRWDKYEYNPHTIATAVKKYKANHVDIYRKDKKQINVTSNEEMDSYLPKNLDYMEGLQLKELEKKEAFKKMNDALSQLDQNAREILMLVADGKSEKEIMEILKIPRGTVASRKSKSIKKLAEILKI